MCCYSSFAFPLRPVSVSPPNFAGIASTTFGRARLLTRQLLFLSLNCKLQHALIRSIKAPSALGGCGFSTMGTLDRGLSLLGTCSVSNTEANSTFSHLSNLTKWCQCMSGCEKRQSHSVEGDATSVLPSCRECRTLMVGRMAGREAHRKNHEMGQTRGEEAKTGRSRGGREGKGGREVGGLRLACAQGLQQTQRLPRQQVTKQSSPLARSSSPAYRTCIDLWSG